MTDKERSSQVHDYPDPLAVIAEIMMKNKDIDPKLSLDAAAKLAPYLCSKKGDCGKKDEKRKAAKKAGNRFSPMPPPKLIINNKG
ncbi:TPA: terminase small subunit [Proteus mirabilis]|nr:terminase small subunit [Proteus mirabilis]